MNPLVKEIEKKHIKKELAPFEIGDTVNVHIKIIEGDKHRVQIYSGLVIGKHGSGLSATFSVSRVAFGYANEKTFPVYSPNVTKVEVVRRGKVRKSKLTYIRGKLGKAAKVEGIFTQIAAHPEIEAKETTQE